MNKKAFTLLEILLVVAAIAILAGIVILALNPAKQLADARNAQRESDVTTILNAVYQYYIDEGDIPSTIYQGTTCEGSSNYQICKGDASSCTGLTDLEVLIDDELYLVDIPYDPTGSTNTGAGYRIFRSEHDRITVCAPDAERDKTISVSR